MTPDDLANAGHALHGSGHGWATRLARDLGVNYDSLRHMLAGRRPIPSGMADELAALLASRRQPQTVSVPISPPPATLRVQDDRDGLCGEAIAPALDALATAAERAGWHPTEVIAAILIWAAHHAGDGAGTPPSPSANVRVE